MKNVDIYITKAFWVVTMLVIALMNYSLLYLTH